MGLSSNPNLPWSRALIERYSERWNWKYLGYNDGLPWTVSLIEDYEDRWDWSVFRAGWKIFENLQRNLIKQIMDAIKEPGPDS